MNAINKKERLPNKGAKKIAIVTGASSGLGRAFAKKICDAYPDLEEVWIIARRRERLEELARYDHRIRPAPFDLSCSSEYGSLLSLLNDQSPKVTILVNAAGVETVGEFSDNAIEEIEAMVALNIGGILRLSKCCYPHMEKGGFIINVSSITSFVPSAGLAVYSSSKAFVSSFSKALRQEYRKKGINVLTLEPGNMATEMNRKGDGRHDRKIASLPYLDLDKLTSRSLKKAANGKGAYVPGMFYKFYKALCKFLPSSLMMKFTEVRKG